MYQANNTKSWRDYARKIKAAQKELADYFSIMTEYERQSAQNEISNLKATNMEYITKGILQEHEAALQKFKSAHKKTLDERKKEVASWDAQRLSAEMQTYDMLIDQAVNTPSGAFDGPGKGAEILESTYKEAVSCGDKYKARAIAEVLKSAPAKFKASDPEINQAINHLAKQAERDMAFIRTNLDIRQAEEEARNAYGEYTAAREEMITEVKELGEHDPLGPFAGGPFAQALKRVQQTPDGKIQIYEPNDPEVTGVFIKASGD